MHLAPSTPFNFSETKICESTGN